MPGLLIEVFMENANNTGKCSKTVISVLAILGAFLLMAFLVRQMTRVAQPVGVGADRAAARAKDNAAIRAEGAAALENWGYVDQPRGIVRLPVEEAKKLTIQGYQNAAAFRTDVLARSEKASAPPPKPVNPFE
jgi:hypothetical protein